MLCCTHVLLLDIFHYISYIILGNLSLVPQGAFSYQNIVMEYNYCIELIFLQKESKKQSIFLRLIHDTRAGYSLKTHLSSKAV